ncbi:hypothetical protein OKW98_10970 [Pseudomonas sp. KU26590]|uniref:hypothetical protein n=1 Tax=Pseudomonas sp. KU26590 TaxID=2991051 RepID=UPI00223CE7F5|nr:hypothetical protein [Pseudomonas sp. KU26590]UZJ62189.1 hypothetical protein OKW98_10970 [Pseudomonas sp. KU26590]
MVANDKTQHPYDKPYVTGKNPGDVIERDVDFTVEVFTNQIQIYKYVLCLIDDDGRAASTDPVLIAPETPVGPDEPIKSKSIQLRSDVKPGKVTAYFIFIQNTKGAEHEFQEFIKQGKDLRTFNSGKNFEGDSYIVK